MRNMQKERDTLIRVMALSDGYVALYTVDLQTEHYAEFYRVAEVCCARKWYNRWTRQISW